MIRTLVSRAVKLICRITGSPGLGMALFLLPLQGGDTIHIGYTNIWLYAWWEDELGYNPYQYIEDPQTGGMIITQYIAYDDYISTVIIPDTLEGKPVTVIGEGAFADSYLDSIILPSQLVHIGNKAFDGSYLTVLLLPENLKSLGEGAFYGSKVVSIEIGAQVIIKNETSLGTYGDSFLRYYHDQGSRAGVYLYQSGAWRGPFVS